MLLTLSARSTVGSVGSTGAARAADGSTGSTGAARVGGEADQDGVTIELAVDAAAASPSVPRTS